MKKAIAIILLTAIVGCKKKDIAPTPVPTSVCGTITKVFEGKYISNTQNQDTIKIVYNSNNCPTENSNNYSVYGLGKALKSTGTSAPMDTVKVYTILSNETMKTASTNYTICNWGFMATGKLNCDYKGIGAIQFTKIN